MVGRISAPNRDARTRCRKAPHGASGHLARRGGYAASVFRVIARALVLLLLAIGFAACSPPAASFEPSGACIFDGSGPGAYPDLEAHVPTVYRGEPPGVIDSGRNCSDAALGTLAGPFDEVRFAGATWSFGAERALVLAVFSAPGIDADMVREFYTASATDAPRVEILDESEVTIARRRGFRLDAKRVERLQTVVVWPAGEPDLVNVVVTNDLPEARIQEAIEAFGDR
jgi:hypothetical protein